MPTNPERLILLLGGPTRIAAHLGIDVSGVSKWVERKSVPPHHNAAILKMAGTSAATPGYTRHAFMGAIRACLAADDCPTCGQPIRRGVRLKPRAGARTVSRG